METTAAEWNAALKIIERRKMINLRLAAGEPKEICGVCGRHALIPWCVVEHAEEGDEGAVKGVTGHWKTRGVCDDCHEDPPAGVKGHFFEKAQAAAGARRAGSSNLGGAL